MKLVLCAGAALALISTAAYADQFAGFYGNTLTVTDPDGSKAIVYVNADHTWTQRMPDGKSVSGTYSWKDDTHFCVTVTDPAPKPGDQHGEECHEITGDHKVGDTWTMTGDGGKPASMTLTAGRQ